MIQTLEGFSWLITVVGVPFAWYLLKEHNQMRTDLDELKLYIAREYVHKTDFTGFRQEFRELISELKKDLHTQLSELKEDVKELNK